MSIKTGLTLLADIPISLKDGNRRVTYLVNSYSGLKDLNDISNQQFDLSFSGKPYTIEFDIDKDGVPLPNTQPVILFEKESSDLIDGLIKKGFGKNHGLAENLEIVEMAENTLVVRDKNHGGTLKFDTSNGPMTAERVLIRLEYLFKQADLHLKLGGENVINVYQLFYLRGSVDLTNVTLTDPDIAMSKLVDVKERSHDTQVIIQYSQLLNCSIPPRVERLHLSYGYYNTPEIPNTKSVFGSSSRDFNTKRSQY